MAKKDSKSSGSYSLLALLKRTLFLHETADVDELAEEVHEYMLKDQSLAQLKERYVTPMLHGNPSFREATPGGRTWKLSEGNKVNDSIYEVFKKYHAPLSERQLLNRLAKEEHLAKIDIALDLKNDARFADIQDGKYWILSEWVVINDYARSVLLRAKEGLTEKELMAKIVDDYHVNPDTTVFLPMLDDRFVKNGPKWTLRRFLEQKTKLRASKIERLYTYLRNAGEALTSDELTNMVFNMPANATDVDEKLGTDPRFVMNDGKWDLRERLYHQELEGAAADTDLALPELPADQPLQASQAFEALFDGAGAEAALPAESAGAEEAETMTDEQEGLAPAERMEAGDGTEASPVTPDLLTEEMALDEPVPQEFEVLRKHVIHFLQEAFQAEGIVYNADIIHELVTSEYRIEMFEDFCLEHFPSPGKHRELTDIDIIKFMIYLAEPTLNDRIIDPCCGTGNVLLHLLRYFQDSIRFAVWQEKDSSLEYELPSGQFYFVQLTPEERQSLPTPLDDETSLRLPLERYCRQRQLTGVDVDRYSYQATRLNLILSGMPEVVLYHEDTLTSKHLGTGLYDLVLGNPPSGEDLPTRFLRRSLMLAKPGGKILLLLPETMFSDLRLTSATLRNQLASQTTIKAVIEFPAPYNDKAYGPKRVLVYCVKKQMESEHQPSIFVGRIADFDGLHDIIEVLDDPYLPNTESDVPIPVGLLMFILASYQQSAYNLLLEGFRQRVIEGGLISLEAWTHLSKKSDQAEETDAAA
jgi:hypothetical protein